MPCNPRQHELFRPFRPTRKSNCFADSFAVGKTSTQSDGKVRMVEQGTLAHCAHINGELSFRDSELSTSAGIRSHLRALDHVLVWQAGNVRARPADVITLDDRDPLALTGKRSCRDGASLSIATNCKIIFLGALVLRRAHNRFRERIEGWLDLVRAMRPECPASMDTNGTGLWVGRANAVLTAEVNNIRSTA
jgi:hypothetical protein